MKPRPHDSWAEVYDLAYEESFGPFYARLTEATLELVSERVSPGAHIIDFGAGTGRLSLPLASRGYAVTAVEPSAAMLQQLETKSEALNPQPPHPVRTIRARMQDDIDWQEQDMALCVFTVVLYLIDEDSLAAAMQTARSALRDGGLLLIDVPCAGLFQGYSRTSDRMQREVTIGDGRGDLFDYEESIRVRLPGGEWTEYHDQFPIRCWRPEEVFDAATAAGMAHLEDVSSAFAGSGSSYHLFKA